MIKWKQIELDLLEDENHTLPQRVKAMALHIRNGTKTQYHGYWETQLMGRDQCTGSINYSDEHCTQRSSWSGLLKHQDSLGQFSEQICSSWSYCTKPHLCMSPYQMLLGGKHGDNTRTCHRTPKIEGGLQQTQCNCHGLEITGIIMLSMPTPSWDTDIGTLGRVLDPRVIISHLNTESGDRDPHLTTRTWIWSFKPTERHTRNVTIAVWWDT